MLCTGVIQKDGTVLESDGSKTNLPVRGTDPENYPEVLIDAMAVGGKGTMSRQSIKPYIGLKCSFERFTKDSTGFNFTIIT